jgi:hypothetical protein
MHTPRKPQLENLNTTTDMKDHVRAAIDPTGGVRIVEPGVEEVTIVEELKAVIDPTGGVKKTDLL